MNFTYSQYFALTVTFSVATDKVQGVVEFKHACPDVLNLIRS